MMNMNAALQTGETLPLTGEVLRGGRVKGGMLSAHLRWVTDTRSGEEFGQIWAALPPNVRNAVDGMILPTNWYSFADLMALDRAIVQVIGRGTNSILREVGAHSARVNLDGVYRAYKRQSVQHFLTESARLHHQFQDFGQVEYEPSGATSGKMIHSGYTSYSPMFCQSAIGYYVEAVTLHGGRSPQVIETRCQCRGDESCTMVIRWR